MAIKLPDPGNGIPEQKTGNDEWTNMKIVRDNFADQSNAASRLIGSAPTEVSQNVHIIKNGFNQQEMPFHNIGSAVDVAKLAIGDAIYLNSEEALNRPPARPSAIQTFKNHHGGLRKRQFAYAYLNTNVYTQVVSNEGVVEAGWAMFYTDKNTTVDSNKNIKTSSPVVRVFSDHLDKIHEANDLPIKYTRNGVGDYTIEGTTGLRENDWQIVIPKDDHDNQLIAFTLEDDDGTIRLKTYKRTFNMTTFMFEPDLSEPMDIPEDRWVDLHFNDLPQEQTDEPI